MAQFDTLVARKTFEAMRRMGSDAQSMTGTGKVVFSRTLRPADLYEKTGSAHKVPVGSSPIGVRLKGPVHRVQSRK